MPNRNRNVMPGPRPRTVRTIDGQVLEPPADWELLPPGDAGLTRKVKAGGASWTVKEQRGRRMFSRGVWAPAERIAIAKRLVERQRSSPEYARRLASDRARRERKQGEYVEDFRGAVLAFLDFAPRHAALAEALADAVTAHATPVGSGTVARTQRIPIGQRAESAVIAWLRHATTAYDDMSIPRVKGMRRAVRRELARRSRELLERYRRGQSIPPSCPLQRALQER